MNARISERRHLSGAIKDALRVHYLYIMNPRLPIVLSRATVAKQLPVIAAISAADLAEPCLASSPLLSAT